ncbi:hypothetical protein PG987_008896 [Apiospora arundinis]
MARKRAAEAISGGSNNGEGSKRHRGDHRCEARETMILDPEGDVTIATACPHCDQVRRFQASSSVLRLASPVFSKMLGPNFQEGEQFRRTGHATIALYEDDPEATERVLCALHHHPDVSAYYSPDELLPMAMFSDKYDCSRALSPWVPHWCYVSTGRAPKASDIAHTILSAYLLRAFNFSEICAKAALYLSPFFRGSWQKMETMLLMPDRIIGHDALPYGFPLQY